MDTKSQTLGLVAIVALLSSAIFRTSAVPTAQTQQPEDKPKKTQTTQAPTAGDDVTALDLLADSLGIDISPDGLKRRTQRALKALTNRQSNDDLTSDVRFLWLVLQAVPNDTPGIDGARSSLRTFGNSRKITLPTRDDSASRSDTELPIDVAVAFLTQHFRDGAPAGAVEPLDSAELRREVLRVAAKDQRIRVRFLIVTLPDPVDSFTGWQFDPMLDAVTQAVSASDYTLDRFYLPDAGGESSGHQTGTARGHAHEDQPGFVIFRKHVHQDETDAADAGGKPRADSHERLVLQLVFETPTAGVHVRALARAVRLAARWNDGDDGVADPCGAAAGRSCVRILGPTFSGTVESMARAIDIAKNALAEQHVWILSGSATDPSNGVNLKAVRPQRLQYQVTVQPDDVLIHALLEHMGHIDWTGRIAVLFEGNTQYGRQIRERVRHENSPRESKTGPVFPSVLNVPFPMNISRLRREARSDQPTIDRALGMPSKFRPLSMEENGTPSDQIPSLFPATAASYLELQMSEMLQSLSHEQVRTVALMATDPRDKLYLAQQISRFAPNLSMVIAESDSLYGHPDYARYLQGAIVASTYPLHSGNQRWRAGADGNIERRQFANGSSQGIYNAALALLNYTQNGEPLVVAGGTTPPLVDYDPPAGNEGGCEVRCAPPVWISVVGRNGLWSLRAYAPDAETQASVFKAKPSGGARVHAGLASASPLFIALCLALPFAAGLGWSRVRRARAIESARAAPASGNASPYSRWGVASVAIAAAFIAALGGARFRLEHTIVSAGVIALAAVALLAAADILRRTLAASPKAQQADLGEEARLWRAVVFRWMPALATVWGIANLGVYAWSSTVASPADLVPYLTRAMNLGSGVSPTLPVAFLCAAAALWAVTEVRRARTPRAALTDPNVQELLALSVQGGLDRLRRGWTYFNGLVAWAPARVQAVALIAVLASCAAFDPLVRPLVSVEGPAFGRFVTTILLVLQVLIALSLGQFVYLWWSSKRVLDRMASHPWVEAYQRVPPDLFPPSVFPRAPRLVDLQRLVTRVGEQLAALGHPASFSGPAPVEYDHLARLYEDEMRTVPDTFWSKSRTWPALVAAVARSVQALEVAPTGWSSIGPALHTGVADHQDAWSRRAEDLYAMSMAFVIRDALARLWHNLIFITGGTVLVFCSHALYPFQPQRQLAAIGWSYFAVVFAAVVVVLVQIRRNQIISRLVSATPEDRRTWDSALVIKLALFGLVPLLTLFAAQFPDVGAVVLRWIEPVQKALP